MVENIPASDRDVIPFVHNLALSPQNAAAEEFNQMVTKLYGGDYETVSLIARRLTLHVGDILFVRPTEDQWDQRIRILEGCPR